MKFFVIINFLLIITGVVFNAPLFKIKAISFPEDLIFVDKNKIQNYTSNYLEKNIFYVTLFSDLKDIPTLFSEIKSINIKKNGLNNIYLDLNERKAWISCIVDGNSFFIDKEGYILTENNSLHDINSNKLFIIKGLSKNDFIKEKIKETTLNKLISLKTTFDIYLNDRSLLIEKTTLDNWNLIIDDNITVLFGELDNFKPKFKKLLFYLNSSNTIKNIEYIDCRIDNKLLIGYGN